MDIFILDDQFRRREIIEGFESVIWTERFSSWGDFQLVIPATIKSRSLFKLGGFLSTNSSESVMIVENVENQTDSDGKTMLKVTGRSLESLLDMRVARPSSLPPATTKWIITQMPRMAAGKVFTDICRQPTGPHAPDYLPWNVVYGPYNRSSLPEVNDNVTFELETQSVYSAIKYISDLYDQGFMVRLEDTVNPQLNLSIFQGSDRTTSQNNLEPVIFSAKLDNLTSVTELSSITEYRNVCYVYSPVASAVVYVDGASASTVGPARRVMYVRADDVDVLDGTTAAKLNKIGLDALTANRSFTGFDGELSPNSGYTFYEDYFLGDLVEMRNAEGVTNRMRVTEQIFVSDKEGDRAYPTLAVNLYITPGSWFAWSYNQVWNSVLGVWEDA